VITAPPVVDRAFLVKALLSVEPFRALQQREPEAFDEMVAAASAGLEQGLTIEQALGLGRSVFVGTVQRYLPTASDEAMLMYGQVLLDTLEHLQPTPDTCAAFVFTGAIDPARPMGLLPKELKERDLAAKAAILRTGDPGRLAQVGGSQSAADLEQVVEAFLRRHGARGELLLDGSAQAHLSAAEACRLATDLYRIALDLPKRRAAGVVRRLHSS